MKKIKFFAIAALFLGFSVNAMAQTNPNPTVSAPASAGATIIAPLSIENTQSLEFGNIVASSTGGTVTVAPGDATTASYDGVAAPAGLANTIQSAKFTVTGEAGSTFKITMPTEDVTLTSPESETMTITLSKNLGNTGNALAANGTSTLYVGGTLSVNPNQKAGAYTGGFTVTVAYE